MTGRDPMADLRGRYSTARGAARVMVSFAGRGLPETAARITAALRMPEIELSRAGRGDCLLADVETPDGRAPALGLVAMTGRHGLFVGAAGLVALPLRQCRMAWRV